MNYNDTVEWWKKAPYRKVCVMVNGGVHTEERIIIDQFKSVNGGFVASFENQETARRVLEQAGFTQTGERLFDKTTGYYYEK